MTDFHPNPQQLAIAEWIRTGTGNAIIGAVAGSGKTSTLVRVVAPLVTDAVFCAFNRHIADELAERLRGTDVRVQTIHSLGMAGVRKRHRNTRVEAGKYRSQIDRIVRMVREDAGLYEWIREYSSGDPKRSAVYGLQDSLGACEDTPVRAYERLASLCRTTLTDPRDREALRALDAKFSLDIEAGLWPIVDATIVPLLRWGIITAATEIDFDDMVWLPNYAEGMTPDRYGWVMVDECQDLNAAQRGVVGLALRPGGRLLAVGDARQAVYGFSGADSDSFERIRTTFDAEVFPLSVCYRCPSSHLDMAREIVPQIEARPGAPVGDVGALAWEDVTGWVKPGDLVICRVTAPLIGLCYSLILSGVRATVRGRDIGVGLKSIIRQVSKRKRFAWPGFGDAVDAWWSRERAKLRAKGVSGDDDAMVRLNDRAESLLVIYRHAVARGVSSVDGLMAEIDRLFSDDGDGSLVVLSTVHRAKGLEADRVMIVDEHLMPHPCAKVPWQVEQEWNLRYVALTRAKAELRFAFTPSKSSKQAAA